MKVSYKGVHHDLPPKLQEKLDAKFAKLSKLLEKRGEREAHVIVTNERHLHNAEIILQFYDHQLVGAGSDADLFTAISGALTKIEKQALKNRTKWREKARRADIKSKPAPVEASPAAADADRGPRVIRVNHHERRKPMTLEEAVFQMEKKGDYLVYRDAEREALSVLIRRKDGDFDLVET